MIEPLTLQVARGQRAASDLRAAENMMALMAQWDLLRYSEKLAEIERHTPLTPSRFAHVPGFDLAWCGACLDDVLLDYTDDPEGACMACGSLAHAEMEAAA